MEINDFVSDLIGIFSRFLEVSDSCLLCKDKTSILQYFGEGKGRFGLCKECMKMIYEVGDELIIENPQSINYEVIKKRYEERRKGGK